MPGTDRTGIEGPSQAKDVRAIRKALRLALVNGICTLVGGVVAMGFGAFLGGLLNTPSAADEHVVNMVQWFTLLALLFGVGMIVAGVQMVVVTLKGRAAFDRLGLSGAPPHSAA